LDDVTEAVLGIRRCDAFYRTRLGSCETNLERARDEVVARRLSRRTIDRLGRHGFSVLGIRGRHRHIGSIRIRFLGAAERFLAWLRIWPSERVAHEVRWDLQSDAPH